MQPLSHEAGSSLTVSPRLVTAGVVRVSHSGFPLKGCNTSCFFCFFPNGPPLSRSWQGLKQRHAPLGEGRFSPPRGSPMRGRPSLNRIHSPLWSHTPRLLLRFWYIHKNDSWLSVRENEGGPPSPTPPSSCARGFSIRGGDWHTFGSRERTDWALLWLLKISFFSLLNFSSLFFFVQATLEVQIFYRR